MADLENLVDAIDVIVTAPYLVDIATLYVVVRNSGDDVMRQWCCMKSCQIPSLVAYLAKSLFEERGIEIFERFCRVADFSKSVVDSRPGLLSQLLARAYNEGEESKTNLLCCKLLGAQTLQTSGFPGELPRYLEKLMRAIHKCPTANLLHAMREIVGTQSARVLKLVDEDILVDFIKTCKLLTKDNTSNWHEAAIISINIGSAVCDEVFLKDSGYPQDIDLPQGSDVFVEWGMKMLGYFDGLKAPRFLHSIVARVMFFTSRNQDIPMPTRSRMLDIVFETLERFRSGLQEFSYENPIAVEKLWRNTGEENLDFDARLSAFAVAYRITPEGVHPDNIEAVLQQLVAVIVSEDKPCNLSLHAHASSKANQLTEALCFLLQNDRKACLEMLHQIVDFVLAHCRACQHPDADTYSKTRTALVLLQALFESMNKHQHVFITLFNILDKPEFPEWTPWLQDMSGGSELVLEINCRGNLACTRKLSVLRNQLCHDFSVVLLHGACTTAATLSTKEFAFLQERAFFCKPKAEFKTCQYPADVDHLAFIPPPPQCPRVEGDWRQQIVDIMGDLQRQSTEAVIDQVNTVCHEFEKRCETVEEPLRRAESRAAHLQEELDQTRTRLNQQEATNSAVMGTLETVEILMDEKVREIDALNERNTQIRNSAEKQNDRIAQLMADIASLKLEHATKLTDLRAEAARTKQDLETLNKAERFSWEEQLEAEKQDAEKQAATITWLESEKHKLLEEQKADHHTHQENVQRIKREHEQAYNKVVEQTVQLNTQLNDQNAEITELKQAVQEREEDLRGSTERLHELARSEKELLKEKGELQEHLQMAQAKEKKVLAAIQGQEQE